MFFSVKWIGVEANKDERYWAAQYVQKLRVSTFLYVFYVFRHGLVNGKLKYLN